jgi:hypothetical protein
MKILKRRCPGFATIRHLVLSFWSILCGGQSCQFATLGRESSGYWAWGDRRVCPAVEEGLGGGENAVKHAWSNGRWRAKSIA